MSAAPHQAFVIDRHQALTHLGALGWQPGEIVPLRFFFPTGDPRKATDKGRNLPGTFPDLPWNQMEDLQSQGRGCYFVVNGGGHRDADVTLGRAIFYEHDTLSKDAQRALWQPLGLPAPTIQIDTGGKSVHSYWRFSEPIPVDQWRLLQADLLELADADRSIKNPSRVMRLAGAWYFKPGIEPVRSLIL